MINFLPNWLEVLIMAAVPVVELRGAIPYGILALDMSILQTFILSYVGSLIPAPFILLFVKKILEYMSTSKVAFFRRIAEKLNNKGTKKIAEMKKTTFWGLTLFIAIPLPGTGVWTGCLVAALLGMRFKYSMGAAVLGTLIAGIVVTAIVASGAHIFGL
mgnify:CR=1 FL=1|jgi:uncharacterized membrane protein